MRSKESIPELEDADKKFDALNILDALNEPGTPVVNSEHFDKKLEPEIIIESPTKKDLKEDSVLKSKLTTKSGKSKNDSYDKVAKKLARVAKNREKEAAKAQAEELNAKIDLNMNKKTPPKNKPGVVNKGNITKAGLGAAGLGLGAGLLNDKLSGDGTDDSTTTANNTDSSKTNTDTDKNGNDTTPSKTPKKKGTPWWIARNRSLIRKPDVPFRTDVALKRFRNPSSNKDYSVISSEYEYLVDYLIAEGHAETVEEATYVMEQMGEEVAVEILNEVI